MLSHFWSRGTLFNPSSPKAAVVGSIIKSKVCISAKVYTPSQSEFIDENSVVKIMEFAEYDLSILKTWILTSQENLYRPLCVYKLYYLLRFVCLSLSQRTSRILSAYVDDKAYSVELAGAVSSKRNSSYSSVLLSYDGLTKGYPPKHICKENVQHGMDRSWFFRLCGR